MSDKDLDGLDQLAAAYRKLPRPEPSPALDAAILAQARAAVAKPARRNRWPTWIASAAAVTLAVGLAWRVRVGDEAGQPAPLARDSAPAAAPAVVPTEAPAPTDALLESNTAPVEPDGAAGPVAQPMAEQPKLDAQERKAVVSDDRGATEDAFRDKAPGGKDQADSALRANAAGKRADAPAESVEVLAAPAPPPPARPVLAAPAPAPPPPAPPAPAAPQSVTVAEPAPVDEPLPFPEPGVAEPAAAAAGAPARDEELRFQQLKKEAAEGERAQAEVVGGLDAARTEEKRRRESPATPESPAKAAAAEPSATGARQAAPATVTGVLGATAPADRRDADAATFEHVRELVRAGRRDDARKALREFRKAHPDATIPDDLRDLLR